METETLGFAELERLLRKRTKQIFKTVKQEQARLRELGEDDCRASTDDTSGWVCNRPKGHSGQHVAVTSYRLVVVWTEGDL